MRTTLLLFCSTVFSLTPIDIISQNEKVTIKEDKIVTVDEIFDIIQSQTDYTFIYRSDLFKDFPLVTLNKGTIKVKDLLSKAVSNVDYHFELLKHNTIVIEKEVSRIIQEAITGNVTDENKFPLVNVTVQIKGTRKGVLTDFDGNYSITGLKTNDVLIFSSMGFETQSIKVDDKKVINVVLKESDNELDEVVVVSEKKIVNTGYQAVSKAKSVGSFESVGAEVIETKFQTNILERLEGTISGLSLYRGDPVIRGVSTFYGESYPLIVLDGVIYEGELESINPNEIENVSVLKDASAASIYGARAANGVIVVTTKQGVVGKPTFSYRSSFQIEPLPSRSYQNLMTSPEFVDYQVDIFNTIADLNEDMLGSRKNSRLALDEVNTLLYDHLGGLISTDFLNSELDRLRGLDGYDQIVDELLTPKYTQQHNLSLRGGSKTHQYALSFNYTSNGSFDKDRPNERLGLNIKNYFKINDWLNFDMSVLGNYNYVGYDVGITGINFISPSRLPYEVLRDEDGNPVEWNHIYSRSYNEERIKLGYLDLSYYPLNELKEKSITTKIPSVIINFKTNIKLSEALGLELRGQKEIGKSRSVRYSSKDSYTVRNSVNNETEIIDDKIIYNIPYGDQISESFRDRSSYTLRAQLNYSKLFNKKHDVNLLLGGERRQVTTDSYGFTRYGYDPDNLTFADANEFTPQAAYRSTDDRYISVYGNASYMFDDKLGINVSARIDESNVFGKNPKYKYRPLWSFGANYIIDTEPLSWLNRLKFRATYGISGNVFDDGGPYALAIVSDDNDAGETSAIIQSPPNEELRWEQTNITNIAIDYELFSKKLKGTIEFYNRNTTDAVAYVDSDPILGWTRLPKNYASLNNKGIEFQFNTQFINTDDFRWNGNLILNYNRNKVTKFVEQYTSLAQNYLDENQLREGQALNTLYSIRYAGLNEKGAPLAYKADGTIVENYLELGLEDLIDEGTYDPPYHASYTNNITYKQFDLSFLFIYYGGHVQRDVAAGHYSTFKNPHDLTGNLDRIHLNYWKKPGDEDDIYTAPALHWDNQDNPNYVESAQRNIWTYADIHVQKANYVKLRNITLAYNAPKAILEKINFSNLRLTFDVRNPFRWSNNRNNLDPEAWSEDGSRGTAVMPTYTFAINLNF
ncbi:SusC/RagA family TonB-linked outer membrane protein [Flavivirga aquimarina]|uniref:SusC/RagA family TonB-linked outer membrane protein n=1 Tax=Flavivirga aquimarina TaxID=2027862 RepID=A0ABT8W8E5_9FLAO|nr:SusC/RagA family TonB-linked outer membrane protein [Flavivirga aquimarina]MDO5969400.1 SusC/RagA family TonB-linked outer membrane protein [Flavivirga aquimarina]